MAFQDDSREKEIRSLFDLSEPENNSRQNSDAVLVLSSSRIEFELKSTQIGGSITTARDVGFNHLQKWKKKHWLVGVYNKNQLQYVYYLDPRLLLPWIIEKENYIKLDYSIAQLLHKKIDISDMYKLIGQKTIYSYEEALGVQKNQYKMIEYKEMMDLDNGYSPEKMLSILQDRAKYLMLRGYTLNNPHIPNRIMISGVKITVNHAERLRSLVETEL